MNKELLEAIAELATDGEGAVLATIVAVKGSAPRRAGSKMLIYPDGHTRDTIGGGCGEAEVKRAARGVFETRRPCKVQVDMLNDAAAEEGMACGGVMDVWLQWIGGQKGY